MLLWSSMRAPRRRGLPAVEVDHHPHSLHHHHHFQQPQDLEEGQEQEDLERSVGSWVQEMEETAWDHDPADHEQEESDNPNADADLDPDLEDAEEDHDELSLTRARFAAARRLRQQMHLFNCTHFKRSASKNCARKRRILAIQLQRQRCHERRRHEAAVHGGDSGGNVGCSHHQHILADEHDLCSYVHDPAPLPLTSSMTLPVSSAPASLDSQEMIHANATVGSQSPVNLLQEELNDMRDAMSFLERSHGLQQSYRLTARINRFGAAVEILQCYYKQFSHGYNPTNFSMFVHNQISREMLFSIMDDNVMSREVRGIDNFLCQWETYTKCHRSLRICVTGMTLVEQDDHLVSVATPGEMRLVFSEDTIEKLYPALLSQQSEDGTGGGGRIVASQLVGKEIVLPFEKVFHFNDQGKIVVLESKVNLHHALLQVVTDPVATTQIVKASVITEEGHWKTHDEFNGIEAKRNALPKQLLCE